MLIDNLVHLISVHRFGFKQFSAQVFQYSFVRRQNLKRSTISFINKSFHFKIDLSKCFLAVN